MSGDRQERSVSRSRGDYLSDEENFYRGSREKFRRERRSSRERGFDRSRGDRKDFSRSRSRSPMSRDRRYRRSSSPRRDRDRERRAEAERDGDHYIPNYNRDGYVPAPRYGNNPEANGSQFGAGGNYGFGGPAPIMSEGAGVSFPRGRRGSRNQDYDDYYGDLDNPGGDPFYSDDFNGNPAGLGNAFMGNKPHSIDPNKLDTLVSFKHFSDWVSSQDPAVRHHEDELERRYAIYKENFNVRQLNNFFEQHKSSDWFRERYHPKLSQGRKKEIIELKKKLYQQFVDDLNSGKFDDIDLDDNRTTEVAKSSESKVDEKPESEESSENKATDSSASTKEEENSNALFIKSVPPSISREQVVKLCETVDGFSYLSLSEPNPQKKYHRLGWIVFKEGCNMQEAFDALNKSKIDEFQFHLALHKHQLTTRPRVAPQIANLPERLRHDEEKVRKLIDLLDQEAHEGFEGNRLVRDRLAVIEARKENEMTDSDNSDLLHIKKSLDLHMEYLRKVHLFCYYCGIEADSLEEFTRKCVERHLRKTTPEPVTNSTSGKPNNNGQTWVKNLDKKIDMRLSDYSPTEIEKIGGKNPESELDKFTQKNVNKVDEGRYRCSLCNKLFKGEEFVKKHIGHKHPESFAEISEEVEYFNNYVRDPFHITQPSNTAAPGGPGAPGAPGMPGFFPFMQPPNNFMSPGFGMNMPFIPQAAAVGTPLHQIPRIGFDTPRGRGAGGRVLFGSVDRNKKTPGASADRLPVDPRQVKSYVDLDAPAEGDVDIHYG